MKFFRTRGGQKVLASLLKLNHRFRRANRLTENSKDGVNTVADIQTLFDTMAQRFNPEAASGLDAVFQYKLDDDGSYFAAINADGCTVEAGEHDDPSVTLLMDSQTFTEVLNGETNGMQAFMTGRIRAEGDIMLATRLEALFPVS